MPNKVETFFVKSRLVISSGEFAIVAAPMSAAFVSDGDYAAVGWLLTTWIASIIVIFAEPVFGNTRKKLLFSTISAIVFCICWLLIHHNRSSPQTPLSAEQTKEAVRTVLAENKPDSSPIFHVEISTVMVTPEIPKYGITFFDFVGIGNADTYVINPIQLYIFLSISNASDKPQLIAGYSFDQLNKTSGKWESLCAVSSIGESLYNIQSLTRAIHLDSENMLDRMLMGKSIAPSEVIKGWAAWRCDEATKCGASDLRIKLLSANGIVTTQIFTKKSIGIANLMPANLHVLHDVLNLSLHHTVVSSECTQTESQ